jgi:hypoxanthine phosphoribosyltransferase
VLSREEAWRILEAAQPIVSASEVDATVLRLAGEISARMADACPLVVSVMGGGVVYTGRILPMFRFPLDFDYVHVTRYGDALSGGRIEWVVRPRTPVRDRIVLVLDDILDEGNTLAAIRDGFLADGARRVYNAVFAEKETGRAKPISADFVGVRLPDRYVFGFGMDVRGAWRNLPAIYALAKD